MIAAGRFATVAKVVRLSAVTEWQRAHPLAADVVLVVVLLGSAVVSSNATLSINEANGRFQAPSTTGILVGLVATVAPLAVRRRFPFAALVAVTAGFLSARVVFDSLEASITAIVLGLAFYSAAAHSRRGWRDWAAGACLAVLLAELWRELTVGAPPIEDLLVFQAFQLLLNLALLIAMWALGRAMSASRRRARELVERAEQLEREREEKARRAVFDERVRIARELHDVVAHHVSVMGVQAGAARVVMERDPAKATQALSSIEGSSRQAVVELHRLLGFLRQEGEEEELAPQPSLGQLPALTAQMGAARLPVDLLVEGATRDLPATVEVSAYRIIQEALTNTLKHAGASSASVRVRYGASEVEVEVVDDGRGQGPPPGPGGGNGLIGMRERVNLHGGRLQAGPRAEGGFSVRATFPLNGASS